MGFDPVTVAIAGSIIGAGVSYMNGQEQRKSQESAQNQARQNALKQEKASDEANNRANQKAPDTSAVLSQAQQAGKAGASGTMLTGSQGIDPNALNLGKNTLLGM